MQFKICIWALNVMCTWCAVVLHWTNVNNNVYNLYSLYSFVVIFIVYLFLSLTSLTLVVEVEHAIQVYVDNHFQTKWSFTKIFVTLVHHDLVSVKFKGKG